MIKGFKALEHLGIVFETAFNEYKECNDTRNILKAWDFFFPYFQKDLDIIKKELCLLEIFLKYVSFREIDDDFFKYEVVDKQYVSNRSELLISQEEYDLVKEVSYDY